MASILYYADEDKLTQVQRICKKVLTIYVNREATEKKLKTEIVRLATKSSYYTSTDVIIHKIVRQQDRLVCLNNIVFTVEKVFQKLQEWQKHYLQEVWGKGRTIREVSVELGVCCLRTLITRGKELEEQFARRLYIKGFQDEWLKGV